MTECHLHCVSRAELLLLYRHDHVRGDLGKMCLDLIAIVPHNNDEPFRFHAAAWNARTSSACPHPRPRSRPPRRVGTGQGWRHPGWTTALSLQNRARLPRTDAERTQRGHRPGSGPAVGRSPGRSRTYVASPDSKTSTAVVRGLLWEYFTPGRVLLCPALSCHL